VLVATARGYRQGGQNEPVPHVTIANTTQNEVVDFQRCH
jgi:hypothetical protein